MKFNTKQNVYFIGKKINMSISQLALILTAFFSLNSIAPKQTFVEEITMHHLDSLTSDNFRLLY